MSFDPDNYDGQGKSRKQETEDSAFLVAYMVICLILLVVAIALVVWLK